MPRISIIITSYNQKNYLKETIDSALAQSVRPHEIIIADDCSSDGSPELIKNYVSQYTDLVKAVINPQNLGISENRNSALRQATGDYVAISDGDDRYMPRNLEAQLAALEHDPQASCAYSNLYIIDSQGVRIGIRDEDPQPSGDIRSHIALGQMGLLRSMLTPYTLAEKVGFLDKRFPKHDGYIFTLRLSKYARFAYVPEPLVEYRVHPKGDSKSFDSRARLEYLENVSSEVQSLIQDLPARDQKRIQILWFYRLLRWSLRADLEEGKRFTALIRTLRTIAEKPGYLRYLIHYAVRSKERSL